jgi:hypothetical protein
MASERDIQDVINTLIAEGIGEGEEGMRRIAETILNRAEQRGISPAEVVRQRAQYTGYSSPGPAAVRAQSDPRSISAAQAAWNLAQGPDDPTGGANHYWNPSIVNPSWAGGMAQLGTYGNHAFASDRPVPPLNIPRVAPNPATQSQDLSLMRNPLMSASARQSQATPYPAEQSLDMAIRRAMGETIATVPTSGVGLPPTTRTVPSVPFTLQPTAREIASAPGTTIATIPTASRAQINEAARRAALTANQSNVERNPAPRPVGSSALNISAQRAEQLSQRPPASARLAPGPIGLTPNTNGVRLNQPPIQVVAPPAVRVAPTPMAASARPLTPRVGSATNPVRVPQGMAVTSAMLPQLQAAQQYGLPIMGSAPLSVTVNGAGSYSAPVARTPVQNLQAQGLSPAQAYAAANALNNQQTLEDRVRGSSDLSSSGASAYSISG